MPLHTTNDRDESTAESPADDLAFDRTLCAIVDALAAAEGTTPAALSPPLFASVDVDALERLLTRGDHVTVQFRHNDQVVTVDANGSIVVHSTSTHDDRGDDDPGGDGDAGNGPGGDGDGGNDPGGDGPGGDAAGGDGSGVARDGGGRSRGGGDDRSVDGVERADDTDAGGDGEGRSGRSSLRDVPVLPLATID